MAELLLQQLDPTFIQPKETRANPAITVYDEDLPIIDLSNLNDPIKLALTLSQIREACRTWGFFQVINHGVSDEVLEGILSEATNFFKLPMDEKMKVLKDAENCKLGFCEPDMYGGVTSWREGFDYLNVGYHDDLDWGNQWPQHPPELRKRAMDFSVETEKLALKMIELISLSLGLPAGKLMGFYKQNTRRYSRLHHYPKCPSPHLALGVSPHTDGGSLTFLIQDKVGGLEVQRKTDGEWIHVEPVHNGYVVNVGDLMESWTNGEYMSAMHRIKLNPDKGRVSCLLFFNPVNGTMIEPLDELLNGESPNPKYEPFPLRNYFPTKNETDD